MDKKSKKDIQRTNKIKEIVMKSLLVLSVVSMVSGLIIGLIFYFGLKEDVIGGWSFCTGFIFIPVPLFVIFYVISCTLKEEGGGELNQKDYKIKYYDCTLEEELEDRMTAVYGEIKHSQSNPKNYYRAWHKENGAVVVAVMHVNAAFSEDEYAAFMNEIPEVTERIMRHTLIVIFIEEEKSSYLREIMYNPEYNSILDTKIFSVYDRGRKRLKVNKTDSKTGDKAYNEARKELDKIFVFKKGKAAL